MIDQKNFISDESGAVTVDWVVLTAALVGLGLAVMTVVRGGVSSVADDIDSTLEQDNIILTAFASGINGPLSDADAQSVRDFARNITQNAGEDGLVSTIGEFSDARDAAADAFSPFAIEYDANGDQLDSEGNVVSSFADSDFALAGGSLSEYNSQRTATQNDLAVAEQELAILQDEARQRGIN
ncbi:MAG: hypothetical protein AAGF30_14690 [Pseudomonadota bacterium]